MATAGVSSAVINTAPPPCSTRRPRALRLGLKFIENCTAGASTVVVICTMPRLAVVEGVGVVEMEPVTVEVAVGRAERVANAVAVAELDMVCVAVAGSVGSAELDAEGEGPADFDTEGDAEGVEL